MESSYLINERIFLRAVEPEDLEVMYCMENDPEMWEVSSFTVPYSRFILKQYIADNQNDIYADKQLRLMIVKRDTNEVVGTLDLSEYVPMHGRAAVGVAIKKEFRHKGYAADALSLLCHYAFDFLQLHQLYAQVNVNNEYSCKLFEGCGFIKNGTLKDWLKTAKGYADVAVYYRLNPNK